MNLKGEAGCVGFVYAVVHSFLGVIICDVAYKGAKWFNEETGQLFWNIELCMTTGAVATALLMLVAVRTIMGKASWFVLRPFYNYLAPIGTWFAIIHVCAYGIKAWNTLFDPSVHNGQPAITFMSTIFPACVLSAHHLMSIFGTKKLCAPDHLWKHSIVSIANTQYHDIRKKSNSLNETDHVQFDGSVDSWDEHEA